METLKQFVRHFYQEHGPQLEKWYPGISLFRLYSELSNFGQLLTSPYIPGANPHLDHFFDGLKKGVPLEYMAEEAFFYNFPLKVDRRVLIPRKETELLVEGALTALHRMANQGKSSLQVADIGTGSGSIALALAINYQGTIPLTITAVDISQKSLALAQQNALRLRYAISKQCHLKWHCGDCLLWDFSSPQKFDLIVSNPPYIRESERETVHQQVLKYEPPLALFLKDEEYEVWFQRFFAHIQRQMATDGEAWIEGSEHHLRELETVAGKMRFQTEIKKDYTERDRFLILRGNCG